MDDSKKTGTPDKGRTVYQPPRNRAPDNRTVVQPRQSKQPPSNAKLPPKKTKVTHALTQIRKSIRNQDSSAGFKKAQVAANKALAEDKIVLNNRFVLEETLGAGGMGTVYRAKDLRKVEANDLNPNIAVKVLNDDFKNHPDAFVTLQREASRSHTLSHPNIVTVHDFDRDDDIIFMTMELLEGQGLEVLLRQNRNKGLEKETALKIIKDFCKALEHAHAKDIIHSDLKPGNVYISKDGTKVLDFGIARLANTAHDNFDAGTLGALTPAYASLGMLNGEPPDPRDDVFAAAIIAYEMLTGKHPYERKPADKVLELGLKPERIKSLNKQQWNALSQALEIKREKRTKTIREFVSALTEKKKFPIFKLSTAIFFVVASWLAYVNIYAPNELKAKIEAAYNKSEACYENGDYECAISGSQAVLEMSPNHEHAKQLIQSGRAALIEERVDTIKRDFEQCLHEQNDRSCARAKISELKGIPHTDSLITDLSNQVSAHKNQELTAQHIKRAQQCFDSKKFDCAIESAKLALEISPDDRIANDILVNSEAAYKNVQVSLARRNQAYNDALKKAQSCFSQNKYDCTIRHAKTSLSMKPNSATAESLYQKALFAKQTRQANETKANKLVTKAESCYTKKNYTCAIANAESALEFIPDHKQALLVRGKAKSELEELKKSFNIE